MSKAAIQRILDAEARRLLREANGDAAKATPWRHPHLSDGSANDPAPGLERQVVEVGDADLDHRGEAA